LGVTHVSSCLAAVAVAEALGVETDLVQKGLATYKPAPGRLNVIGGIRKSVLIDDTYNGADPAAMYEALRLFARFPGSHKIAVLGDMLELGDLSDEAHTAVGKEVAAISPTHLVTVGPGGRIIAEGARGGGFSEERIISFNTSQDAMVPVQELMREGSVVLLKGSQSMRMEKITKEIMAEPMRAGELLCRQYGKWLRT
jgi:UDP-N-acetylmuramyl pentapeptide synthase